MQYKAFIYLLIRRTFPTFAQLYMVGSAYKSRVKKSGKGWFINTYKAFTDSHPGPSTNRSILTFRNKFLHQIKCLNPNRYWHCKTNDFRQKSRIIWYQLPWFIQSPEMVLLGPNKAQSSGPESQRLLVDPINCLPTLFNFLTPHMRFSSSSHTDVPVLKT